MFPLTPEELADKLFGPYPPPLQCGQNGPQQMVCVLDKGHPGTHQMLTHNGFWKRWIDDTSEGTTLYDPTEYLGAETDSAPGQEDDEGIYSYGFG